MFEKLLNPRISCYTLNFFNTSANNCHSCSHFCRAKRYTLNFNMSDEHVLGTPRQAAEPPLSPASLLYVLYVLYLTRQAAEPPLSPSSLLYVLYVLYVLYARNLYYMCYIGPYSTYSTYSKELGESGCSAGRSVRAAFPGKKIQSSCGRTCSIFFANGCEAPAARHSPAAPARHRSPRQGRDSSYRGRDSDFALHRGRFSDFALASDFARKNTLSAMLSSQYR